MNVMLGSRKWFFLVKVAYIQDANFRLTVHCAKVHCSESCTINLSLVIIFLKPDARRQTVEEKQIVLALSQECIIIEHHRQKSWCANPFRIIEDLDRQPQIAILIIALPRRHGSKLSLKTHFWRKRAEENLKIASSCILFSHQLENFHPKSPVSQLLKS